jgi:hypothetical protein
LALPIFLAAGWRSWHVDELRPQMAPLPSMPEVALAYWEVKECIPALPQPAHDVPSVREFRERILGAVPIRAHRPADRAVGPLDRKAPLAVELSVCLESDGRVLSLELWQGRRRAEVGVHRAVAAWRFRPGPRSCYRDWILVDS